MADLELLGIPHSGFVRTVRIACEEKGAPYLAAAECSRDATAAFRGVGQGSQRKRGAITV